MRKNFIAVFCFFASLCFFSLAPLQLRGSDIFSSGEIIALGLTQGATEFLPISSTAHMIIVDEFFLDGDGVDVVEHGGASAPSCDNITDSEVSMRAKNAYFSIIQFGSVCAVLLLYRRRFCDIFLGLAGKSLRGRKLASNLILSFLPAAIIGCMVDGVLQKIAYNDLIIASALIIGSVIMVLAEKSYGRGKKCLGVESLSVMQSLSIGLWQCLSFIPGMSRSMVTIVGGYRTGLCRVDAAEYSFLLGAMTLTAATGYKLLKDFSAIAACFSARTFFIGIGIAFTASLFAVKFLVAVISRRGLAPFALYRIPLAIFIVISAYA